MSNLDNTDFFKPDEMKCYSLNLYTYDYYQSVEVVTISFNKRKLIERYRTMHHLYDNKKLVNEEGHKRYSERGEAHWTIEEIEFI